MSFNLHAPAEVCPGSCPHPLRRTRWPTGSPT